MAARNRPGLSENTRLRIKTTKIVQRLHDHVFHDGDLMTVSQVNAARILLNKTLPDLTESDIKQFATGQMTIQIVKHGELADPQERPADGDPDPE